MLARLLRAVLLAQVMLGGLLGVSATVWAAQAGAGGWAFLWLLAGLVLFPALLHALSLTLMFALSQPAGPIGAVLRAWWGELRAAWVIFVGRQPWARSAPGVQTPPGWKADPQAPVPVLLVHGYWCNHRVWDELIPALHNQGHPVLAVDLEPVFTPLDEYVLALEAAVKQLLQATGARQLALVGHSMGGLAIRAWMRKHGAARVARILTLGTPHQGTKLARWSFSENGRQMRWRSDWLSHLSQQETPGQRRLLHTAHTLQDNVVFPQAEQALPGATATAFSGMGHLQMCREPEVHRWVLEQLRDLTAHPSRKTS